MHGYISKLFLIKIPPSTILIKDECISAVKIRLISVHGTAELRLTKNFPTCTPSREVLFINFRITRITLKHLQRFRHITQRFQRLIV